MEWTQRRNLHQSSRKQEASGPGAKCSCGSAGPGRWPGNAKCLRALVHRDDRSRSLVSEHLAVGYGILLLRSLVHLRIGCFL